MIQSFRDSETHLFFLDKKIPRLKSVERVAMRKLIQLNNAAKLDDLAVPPGNRLEALKGNLKGYHSIRINQKLRIIFRWTDHGPNDVAILNYH